MMCPATAAFRIIKYFFSDKGGLVTKFHSKLCKNDVNAKRKVNCQLIYHYFYCPEKM